MATLHTTLSCVHSKKPVTINHKVNISQMVLREVVEAVLTEEEVVAEVELVGEEQDSKMTKGTNLSLSHKVGRILSHLIHSRLLILHPQILVLYLQILVRHLHLQTLALQILQAVVIQISILHRVNYITLKVSNQI